MDGYIITKEESARDLKLDINAESKFKQNRGQRKLRKQLGWLPHCASSHAVLAGEGKMAVLRSFREAKSQPHFPTDVAVGSIGKANY